MTAFVEGIRDGAERWADPPPPRVRFVWSYRAGWQIGRWAVLAGYPLLLLAGIWAWSWILGGG